MGPGGSIQAVKFWPWNRDLVLTASISGRVMLNDFEGKRSQVLSDTFNCYEWVGLSHYFLGVAFFAVPSSVLYLEGLALTHLTPASLPLATPKTHSVSHRCRQRSTGGEIRLFIGCHPKETLHCCWVASVVFSDACWFIVWKTPPVCPLLLTMLAKYYAPCWWQS